MRKILFSLLVAICFSQPIPAWAAQAFYSVGLYVDVTSDTASHAREKALSEANRKALETIASRITTAEGVTKLMNLEDNQLVNFIKEVAVTSEKSSDVRYIANLNIVINDRLLKAYMAEQEIPYMVGTGRNVMIIPLFREFKTDRPMLWEDGNLWRKSWEEYHNNSPINIFSIPATAENMSAINAEQAASLDGMALNTVAHNNKAPDIYVLDATYDGIDGLLIQISSYVGGTNAIETLRVQGIRGAELFANAIKEICNRINGEVKGRDIQESRTQSEISVIYEYPNIKEWIALEKDLKNIPYIKNLNLEAMGNNKSRFKIFYIGARERLDEALQSKGFSLKEYGDIAVLKKH